MSFDDEMYYEDERRAGSRRPSANASNADSERRMRSDARRQNGAPARRPRPAVDEYGNPVPVRRPRPENGEQMRRPRSEQRPEARRPRPAVDEYGDPIPARRPRPEGGEQVRRPRPQGEQVRRPAADEYGYEAPARRPRPQGEQARRPRPQGEQVRRPEQRPAVRRERPAVDPERREFERAQAREDIRRAHQGRQEAFAESEYSYTDMERRPADRRNRPAQPGRRPEGARPRNGAPADRARRTPDRDFDRYDRVNGGGRGGNGGNRGGMSAGGSGRRSGEPMSIKGMVTLIVSIVAIILGVFFYAMVIRSKMLTVPLMIVALVVCIILAGGTFFLGLLYRKSEKELRTGKKSFFVTHLIVGIISILIFAVGGFYLFRTVSSLHNMSGAHTEMSGYCVYVLNDSEAQELTDAADFHFGILQSQDRENVDQIVSDINEELGSEIDVVEYPGLTGLADALKSGEIDCMLMGDSFLGMYENFEGYESFPSEVRAIWSGQIEIEVETVSNELHDVVTLYISGSDTRNDTLPARSLSDVNIIVSANLQTHQILLVSTPRDYYVPTSVSGGARDKLTQAGAYGVQCSMDTLEMLYDIPVDYYARLNFNGFMDIIDAMGGITVHSDYTFTTGNMIGYTIWEGDNQMDGATALAFARERYAFSAGDNQRGRNQMEVIKGMIRKVTSDPSVLSRYLDILDSVENCFETSMPYDVLAELVRYQLDYGGEWEVITYSATGSPGHETTYSANHPAYVTWPDQNSIDLATSMFNQIEANEVITDPASAQ